MATAPITGCLVLALAAFVQSEAFMGFRRVLPAAQSGPQPRGETLSDRAYDGWRRFEVSLQQRLETQAGTGQRPAAGTVIKPEAPFLDEIALLILGVMFHVLLLAVVACLYTNKKPDPAVTIPEWSAEKSSLDGGFKHGLFSCCDTPCLSSFTFCCLPVRWADSARMAGYVCFLLALLCWIGVEIIGMLLHGFVAWIAIGIIGLIFRLRLRSVFGMDKTPWTTFLDCVSWFFCCCCAAVQEARQLEEASQLDHDTKSTAFPLDLKVH